VRSLENKTENDDGRGQIRALVVTVWVVVTLVAFPGVGSAQDFVESSATVGRDILFLEMSVGGDRTAASGVTASGFATPLLLSYGVGDHWELRFETDGYLRAKEVDGEAVLLDDEGMSDLSVGVKWHTHDGAAGTAMPSVGWLLHADLAVGSEVFRGHGGRLSLRAVAEWELPYGIAVGVMPGVVHDVDGPGRFFTGMLGAYAAKSWTERFWTFAELAAEQLAAADRGGSVVTYNGGAAFLLGPNVQLDAVVGVGANANAADFAWTVKLAMLW
jgi:hypothetical protein